MKKIFQSIVMSFLSLTLISCDNSSSLSESETSIQEPPISIQLAREKEAGETVTVSGIVLKHHYDGQTTPEIVGFWLLDETASIYVYDREVAPQVELGNKLTLTGVKDYYIPRTDESSAPQLNYKGMNQITDVTLLSNDKIKNDFPNCLAKETSISEINKIPLSQDITGNLYRVKGHYIVSESIDHTNYIIEDLNRVDSLLAYTTCNGKDFAWTKKFDQKTVELLLIVSLAKPGVKSWRFEPVDFYDINVVVSDEEEANFAAERTLANFNKTYMVDTTIKIAISDPKLNAVKIDIETTGNVSNVTKDEEFNYLNVLAVNPGEDTIKITATYNAAKAVKTTVIKVIQKPVIENIKTLKEARLAPMNSEVTVEGIVARVTYKGSMLKQGLFLIDDTSSLFCYNSTETLDNIKEIENFNKVIVKGVITLYENTLELKNVEVLYHDPNTYDIKGLGGIINGKTISDIVNTKVETENITSNIYTLTGTIYESNGYGHSYGMNDPLNSEASIGFYSQNSGNDYSDFNFTQYVNKTLTMLIGVQNIKGQRWRCTPLLILSVN